VRSVSPAFESHTRSVALLIVCSLGLRAAFLILAGPRAALTGDELAYDQIAANFAAGRGLYQTNNPFFPGQMLFAWQAPLYPFLLGVLYLVVGHSVVAGKALGVLVSTIGVYLTYDLGRRVFGQGKERAVAERIGLAAGWLIAVYPGLLTNAHLLLSETLFTSFVLGSFSCAARALSAVDERDSRRWLAAGAVCWALATLTRRITLYFTPLFAAWLGWCVWRREGEHIGLRRPPLWHAAATALSYCVVTAALLAPYALRNWIVFGEFVPLETKGGVNLWLGNSPYTPKSAIRDVWKVGVREPMLQALPNDEVPRDRAAYAQAIGYIRSEPLGFFERMPVKFADFWGFERNLVDTAVATSQGAGWKAPSKVAADLLAAVVYVLVMVVGVVGLCMAPGDRWKLLLGGFVVYFVAVHLVVFGDGRFHLPLVPLFALYGGWLLVDLERDPRSASRLLDRSDPRVVVAASLVAGLLAVWLREAWMAWRALG
jgi:dolichyl-phosphate-mannose-protein mannosyltransferase